MEWPLQLALLLLLLLAPHCCCYSHCATAIAATRSLPMLLLRDWRGLLMMWPLFAAGNLPPPLHTIHPPPHPHHPPPHTTQTHVEDEVQDDSELQPAQGAQGALCG